MGNSTDSSDDALLGAAFDASPVASLLIDRSGRVRRVNRAAAGVLGRCAAAVAGRSLDEVAAREPGALGPLARLVEQAAGGLPAEVHLDGPDGRRLEGRATVLDAGAGVLVELRDVTATLRLQRDRDDLLEGLQTVLDDAREGIVGVDPSGRITFANRHAGVLLGRPGVRLTGLAAWEVLQPVRRRGAPLDEATWPLLAAARDGGVRRADDEWFAGPDGGAVAVEYVATPLVRPSGLAGAVVVFSDVSTRRLADLALRAAVSREREVADRQRQLDDARGDFVATVSHELRTPLTSIAGYVEMLLDGDAGPLADTQTAMLRVVESGTRRLLSLVEDLLTVSRMRAGTFALHRRPLDVRALLDGALEAQRPAVAARRHRLDVDLAVGGAVLLGDADRLGQVIANLLDNAVKFTPDGGRVGLRAALDGDELRIDVADTGIGVPPADQARLFERFFRSSNAAEQSVQGSGLGLSIVKRIVELHGGTVGVESTEGAGSCFTVTLPLAASAVPAG